MKRFLLFVVFISMSLLTSCSNDKGEPLQVFVEDNFINGNLAYNEPRIDMESIIPIISSEEIQEVNFKSVTGDNVDNLEISLNPLYEDAYTHDDYFILDVEIKIDKDEFYEEVKINELKLELIGNSEAVIKEIPFEITFRFDGNMDKSIDYFNTFMYQAGGSSYYEPYYYFTLTPHNHISLDSIDDNTKSGLKSVMVVESDSKEHINYNPDESIVYDDLNNIDFNMDAGSSYYIELVFNDLNKGEVIANYYSVIFSVKLDNGQVHKVFHRHVTTPILYRQSVIDYIEENF